MGQQVKLLFAIQISYNTAPGMVPATPLFPFQLPAFASGR